MHMYTHLNQVNLMSGAVGSEMCDIKHFVSLLVNDPITLLLLLLSLHFRVIYHGVRRVNDWVLNAV